MFIGTYVVVVRVNSTILVAGYPGYIAGSIVYVDWRSFDDMLIFKRRQYLPDLCNDLLYSGVRFLEVVEIVHDLIVIHVEVVESQGLRGGVAALLA